MTQKTQSRAADQRISISAGVRRCPLRAIDAATGPIPFRERICCTVEAAMEASGIGRTRLYELLTSGAIASNIESGRRLVSIPSLLQFLEPKGVATDAAKPGADHAGG